MTVSHILWSDDQLVDRARELASQLNLNYLSASRKKGIERELDRIIFETVMRKG